MDILKNKQGDQLVVSLKGRLDTNTAPELEKGVADDLAVAKVMRLDLKELDYISSAGLRVILTLHKSLHGRGASLVVAHPKDEVMEVFDMTGFSSFLTIEE